MKNFIIYLIILPSLYINIFTDTIYTQDNLEKYLRGEVRKSHDFDYEYFNPRPPFLNFVIDNPYTNSIYPNRNISNNQYPQNEPTVCISRKNPNIVVAAWRDFRTGTQPPLRRIGYSYSTNGGITWSPSALIPSHDSLRPLASDPALCTDTAGNFYLATITLNLQYSSIVAVYKSTDNGMTFNTGTDVSVLLDTNVHPAHDKEYITSDLAPGSPFRNNIYVVWSSFEGPALVKSTNSGLTWTERKLLNDDAGAFFDLATGPNGELYVIGSSRPVNRPYGMYVTKSTDGGETFGGVVMVDSTPMNSGPISPHRFPSIAVDISGGARNGYVYAVYSRTYNYATVNSDEDIYLSYSTNSGQNWSTPVRVNNDPVATGKLQMWPWISCDESGNIHIIYYDSRSTPNNFSSEAWIAVSTDGGQSFENSIISSMQFSWEYPDPSIRFGDYINVDSYGGKIIPVWTDQRQPDMNMEIYTALMGDTVIGINITGTEIPSQFRLHQNYPNPFNPVTTVKFEIPKKTHVKLIVYDIMGRELEVLADAVMNPSVYSFSWNAANLSSGIYFCRLSTEDYTETRKMMLIK